MIGPLFVRGILTLLGLLLFVVPGVVFAARTIAFIAAGLLIPTAALAADSFGGGLCSLCPF